MWERRETSKTERRERETGRDGICGKKKKRERGEERGRERERGVRKQ